jgi:hypothetical protein
MFTSSQQAIIKRPSGITDLGGKMAHATKIEDKAGKGDDAHYFYIIRCVTSDRAAVFNALMLPLGDWL